VCVCVCVCVCVSAIIIHRVVLLLFLSRDYLSIFGRHDFASALETLDYHSVTNFPLYNHNYGRLFSHEMIVHVDLLVHRILNFVT
jgi:hypothetical protein